MEFVKQDVSDLAPRGNPARMPPNIERRLNEPREPQGSAALQLALRASRQQYQALLRHMPAAFARCRLATDEGAAPDFIFQEVNPAFEALVGLGMLPGCSLSSCIPGVRASALFAACVRVACSGEAEHFETHVEGLGSSFDVDLYRPAPGEFAMMLVGKPLAEAQDTDESRQDQQASALETIQRVSQVGHWEWAVGGEEVIWSDELYRIAGRDRASWRPAFRNQTSRFPADSLPRLRAAMQAAANKGTPFLLDVKMLRPDGSEPWVTVRGEAERDASGAIVRLRGTVQDISERKAMEEALQHYADEAEDLYQNAPCGYYTTNRVGRILRMNDTQLGWLGYSRPELEKRRDVSALLAPTSHLKFHAAFDQLRKHGSVQDVELEFVRKDGSLLPVLLNARAVTGETRLGATEPGVTVRFATVLVTAPTELETMT